jgi:hypothetical protein
MSKTEDFTVIKYTKRGKCTNSAFKNGWHRVGLVPEYSLLDGGAAGDIARETCLECGKRFSKTVFYLRDQPRQLKQAGQS